MLIAMLIGGTVGAPYETPEDIARQRIAEAAQSGSVELDISSLSLQELPPEIGNLSNMQFFYLEGNPLTMPPPEVVSQGTEAILEYLRERQAMLERHRILTIAGGVGLAALAVLAFRFRRRSSGKKKRG